MLLFLAYPVATTPAWAIGTISLTIAHQQGSGWQASGIKGKIALLPGAGASEFSIEQLELPPPIGVLHNLRLRCPKLKLTSASIVCHHGAVHLRSSFLNSPNFTVNMRYDLRTRRLAVSASRVALAGGHVNLKLTSTNGHWQLHTRGQALALKSLRALTARFISLPPRLGATGKATLTFAMRGRQNSPSHIAANLKLAHVNFSTAGGKRASSGLGAHIRLTADASNTGWAVDLKLASDTGEAYADPIYLNFNSAPLQAALHGVWMRTEHTLHLKRWSIKQKNVLRIHGSARARLAPKFAISRLKASVSQATFPGLYSAYAAPFLIGTPFDSLSTSGHMSGALAIRHNALSNLALKLHDVSFDDKQHRLSLHHTNGSIRWRAAGDLASAPRSSLTWQSGELLHIGLGKTRVALKTAGNAVALNNGVHIPLFDGALDIHKLRLKHLGTPELNILFDATLTPISMPKLSKALGWPTLGGTLAGRLPTLTYKHGLLTLGGALFANVFNGDLAIRHLRLNRPFSALPRLSADVEIRRVNLKTITHTFSFGEIQGLLNGDIDNLQLVDWAPVRFNARFYSAKNDPTDHVISQRALQNISNLGGGGATGMIARTFIGLFSNFGYDHIGFSCRLKQEICNMGGLSPAPNGGYYMVTGAGLPQVTVIGHSRAVSWPTLVSELKNTTLSASPVVK